MPCHIHILYSNCGTRHNITCIIASSRLRAMTPSFSWCRHYILDLGFAMIVDDLIIGFTLAYLPFHDYWSNNFTIIVGTNQIGTYDSTVNKLIVVINLSF